MNNWCITVTVSGCLTPDQVIAVGEHAGAFLTATEVHPEHDTTTITVTVNDVDLDEALRTARESIERAATATGLDLTAIGLEATTWTEYTRRLTETGIPALVGAVEVADMLGVSRARVHQLAERPDFPRPQLTLAAGKLWDRGEIEAFASTRSRKRGRPRKSQDGKQ